MCMKDQANYLDSSVRGIANIRSLSCDLTNDRRGGLDAHETCIGSIIIIIIKEPVERALHLTGFETDLVGMLDPLVWPFFTKTAECMRTAKGTTIPSPVTTWPRRGRLYLTASRISRYLHSI